MASAIFTPPYVSHASSSSPLSPTIVRKPTLYASLSTSQISYSKNPTICSLTCVPHLCSPPFSRWNGLRKHGFSISLKSLRLEKRKKCKGKGVFASLFGVGAPEALVIGVVALLVFGPKGLAEVAKNLGKTLRAFQPTIRELQEVSREFKSTLEKEIGLAELKNPGQGNYTSNTASRIPADTLQSSQLTATPPATTTEDSSATTTTPADSPATTTTPEDSPAIATTPTVSSEDSLATVITPADSQETAAAPAVTVEDSQPTVDPTNGSPSSKAYSSEDILKITEEQLKAIQQKEQPSSESPKTET